MTLEKSPMRTAAGVPFFPGPASGFMPYDVTMKIWVQLIALVLLSGLGATEAAERKPIVATMGEDFKITLESAGTTGYQWVLARPLDERLVKFVSNDYKRPHARQPGAQGCEVLSFKALGEGRTEVHLKYAQLWEKDSPAVRNTNFVVVITRGETRSK